MANGKQASGRRSCHSLTVRRIGWRRWHGVTMMQATESSERLNPASVRRGPRDCAPCWRILGQPQMGSVLVVVADIFAHESFQMPFIEHAHMLKQVSSATPNPTLCDSILPRTAKRGANRFSRHAVVNFLDADGLPGERYAEVDFLVVQAKTSAAGDHDGAVVERVVRFRDASIRTRGSRVDLGRGFHGESFMGAFVIEFLQEGVELGLLPQEVGARRAGGFLLQGEMHALMPAILLGM